jgi:hypothetical protein
MTTIAPPDAHLVTPTYVAPPGACDAHCHVFGPAGRFPYAPARRYTPPDSPKDALAALHRAGLRSSTVLGCGRAPCWDAIEHRSGTKTISSAKRVTLDEWRRRALHEKANEKFWSLLGEFF